VALFARRCTISATIAPVAVVARTDADIDAAGTDTHATRPKIILRIVVSSSGSADAQ
jgi:hypothetical protein